MPCHSAADLISCVLTAVRVRFVTAVLEGQDAHDGRRRIRRRNNIQTGACTSSSSPLMFWLLETLEEKKILLDVLFIFLQPFLLFYFFLFLKLQRRWPALAADQP